mmetsp:Transcript_17139/g.27848  ORF Transcript_17139/g.27848 Transcript_17139/m.27848 type:complete len:201 (+) Transcript_17139:78-680(+)
MLRRPYSATSWLASALFFLAALFLHTTMWSPSPSLALTPLSRARISRSIRSAPSNIVRRSNRDKTFTTRPSLHATRRKCLCSCEKETKSDDEKALIAMTNFANRYNKVAGTTYCSDVSIAAVVIKGLAEHKVTLGAPLCPCRHYDDKQAEAEQGYWNCPCVPMRERKECHCMLFLTEDNAFAGDETSVTPEEVAKMIEGI